jgi:hypothetical protein
VLGIISGFVGAREAQNPLRAFFGLIGMALVTAYFFLTHHIPDATLFFGFVVVLFGAIDLLRYFKRTDKPGRAKVVGLLIVAFVGYNLLGSIPRQGVVGTPMPPAMQAAYNADMALSKEEAYAACKTKPHGATEMVTHGLAHYAVYCGREDLGDIANTYVPSKDLSVERHDARLREVAEYCKTQPMRQPVTNRVPGEPDLVASCGLKGFPSKGSN